MYTGRKVWLLDWQCRCQTLDIMQCYNNEPQVNKWRNEPQVNRQTTIGAPISWVQKIWNMADVTSWSFEELFYKSEKHQSMAYKRMMKERKINKGFQRLEYWDIKRKAEATQSLSPELTYWQQQPIRRAKESKGKTRGWRGQPKPTEWENLISNDRRAFHLGPCLEMCCV